MGVSSSRIHAEPSITAAHARGAAATPETTPASSPASSPRDSFACDPSFSSSLHHLHARIHLINRAMAKRDLISAFVHVHTLARFLGCPAVRLLQALQKLDRHIGIPIVHGKVMSVAEYRAFLRMYLELDGAM
jgi:hypothetical protein